LADGADQQELPAYHNCVAQKICSNGADFAVFSPDGQEVAFDAYDDGGDPEIFTAGLHGAHAATLDYFDTGDGAPAVLGLTWQPLHAGP
jgi:Tol biopolymer transport system component